MSYPKPSEERIICEYMEIDVSLQDSDIIERNTSKGYPLNKILCRKSLGLKVDYILNHGINYYKVESIEQDENFHYIQVTLEYLGIMLSEYEAQFEEEDF